MNRRALLATIPTLTIAGCAARLGLADRVEVAAKYIHVERRGETEGEEAKESEEGDTEADHLVELIGRRYDPAAEPTYSGEIPDHLTDDVDSDGPLTISEATNERLEDSFEQVRYGMRGCESLGSGDGDGDDPDSESDCRDTWLFLDDFNELEVGDVVDVRYGEEMSGIVSVDE